MPDESEPYKIAEVDIFSRGSLQLTFDLIRKVDPSLALQVRNIVSGEPLPRLESGLDTKNADHFRVGLDSFQIRAIVEGLVSQSREPSNKTKNPGMAVVATALIDDWIKLAHKMVAELPESERP